MTCRCATPEIHAQREYDSLRRSAEYDKEARKKERLAEEAKRAAASPNPKNYEILDALPVGECLVLRVKYPSCTLCEYEGVKVMVFLKVSPLDALKWREIDPHFRPAPKIQEPTKAPSPAARFPGTMQGWIDAQQYAKSKLVG
jgi:hypothetical protein